MRLSCPLPAGWLYSLSPKTIYQLSDSMTAHLWRYGSPGMCFLLWMLLWYRRGTAKTKQYKSLPYVSIMLKLVVWPHRNSQPTRVGQLMNTDTTKNIYNGFWVFITSGMMFSMAFVSNFASLVKHPWWLQSPEPLQAFSGGSVRCSRPRKLQCSSCSGTEHLEGCECEELWETGRHLSESETF